MVPGDNFLSLCLSVSLSLFFNYQAWHSWLFLLSAQLTTKGPAPQPLVEEVTEGSPRLLSLLPGVIRLITWLMGGHPGSPHTVLHNEGSFIFNTIECLSHSTLCGEDWLSLCGVSWEARLPSSSFRRAYVPAPACCSWTRKEQAPFFFLFFFKPMNWLLQCEMWAEMLPSAPWMHILAFWYSNSSQRDILRGSGLMFPKFSIVWTTICWAQKKNK